MRINIQPIEKYSDPDNGETLRVHSIFGPTIQGEGPLCGHPAIFVRLAGCNLQCPQCDTEYTGPEADLLQNGMGVRRMQVQDILARVREKHTGPILVVISGGEPFRQNITSLALALLDEDYQVQVETNGTLPPPTGFPVKGSFHDAFGAVIVCSPKAGKVHPKTAAVANAFKYVLSHDSVDSDGLPILALNHTAKPRVARPPAGWPVGAIYLQPADVQDPEINKKNVDAVVQSCLKHGYTLQLQVHKLLNLE